MRKDLFPCERVVIACDYRPRDDYRAIDDAYQQFKRDRFELLGTGVPLKFNSLVRARGYELIRETRLDFGFSVFADLKLCDIPNTIEDDVRLLRELTPEMVTISCGAGIESMKRARGLFAPDTEVIAVPPLTSLAEHEVRRWHGVYATGTNPYHSALYRGAEAALEAGIDSIICPPKDIAYLNQQFPGEFRVTAVGIREAGQKVENDDQNPDRSGTLEEAVTAGAARVVIGRGMRNAAGTRAQVEGFIERVKIASMRSI